MAVIEAFIKRHKEKLRNLGENYPNSKSLVLDFQELERMDRDTADRLRTHPDNIIMEFEHALNSMSILTSVENPEFKVRFKNMPNERGYTVPIREVTAEYIGKFITLEGTVNRISDVNPKVKNALYVCNICDEHNWVAQERRILVEPYRCKGCQKSDFRFVEEESQWTDIQHIQIQEPLEMLKGGENARTIELWTEDDMTDRVIPGDKVLLTGVVRLKPPKTKSSVFDKYVDVNYIESIQQEFEDIDLTDDDVTQIIELSHDPKLIDKMIDSIAPSIYGYNETKEAIALQLFGGRQGKILADGTKARGDIHLLLIGDPGVAKSRILNFVDDIAPKSIYVTGKGTTGAGLTATAEKDEFNEGAWTLKAGALVLAGGGIACIDEFDKMSKEDRGAMHEAMEQQTISIAKAGITTKFKANTSILAASNPKFSRFDNYKPLAEQFDIPPTLISRFDLIFPIRDILDSVRDKQIADHILKMHSQQDDDEQTIKPLIEPDLFKKYIAYSRRNIKPKMRKESMEKISDFYVSLRARGKGTTAAATPRQLEALVRLSEASAKLRLSEEVSLSDVERAIALTEFVLREIATDATTGELDIDRIVTTHPKSVRDRIRQVEEIMQELIANAPDSMATLSDIVDAMKEKNVDKFEVEKIVTELKKKGEIYEPRHGRFMFTEER
ncbi:MAG: minichromosome maintenance protein MCM [Candidatus Altiarchaeota archaeon]|nr:minichromosome maintenance protein MCM [Candidatus Altiarchaeota archaeon]